MRDRRVYAFETFAKFNQVSNYEYLAIKERYVCKYVYVTWIF